MNTSFSLLCRLFGNLFYRRPTDELLTNVFTWLQQKNLTEIFPLVAEAEIKTALDALEMPLNTEMLDKEYQNVFNKVSPLMDDEAVSDFIAFRQQYGLPELENPQHFALLLLTYSWLEDNLDNPTVQQKFCETLLFPICRQVLSQIEKEATLPFYRQLAFLTTEILVAMADDLEEINA